MVDFITLYTVTLFLLMVVFLLWRPYGINESIPPIISAILIFLAGIVPMNKCIPNIRDCKWGFHQHFLDDRDGHCP